MTTHKAAVKPDGAPNYDRTRCGRDNVKRAFRLVSIGEAPTCTVCARKSAPAAAPAPAAPVATKLDGTIDWPAERWANIHACAEAAKTKAFEFALRVGYGQAGATADKLIEKGYQAEHGMNGQVYVTITAGTKGEALLKARAAYQSIGLDVPDTLRFVAQKEVR